MVLDVNTQGTDGGSVTVALPDDVRRGLIAKRVSVGAKTPKGHACSNLVEQIKEYRTATGWQRANLERLIPLQMARLGSQ